MSYTVFTIIENYLKEILQHLKSICKSKKVTVTYQQLVDVRNSFVNWIFQLAIELLPCIFSIDVVLYPGKLSSYRAAEFSMSENFHKITDWFNKPPQLRPVSYNLMNRYKKPASLWLLIPCEQKHHLLEHVMEYGLMELLPKEARSLLSRWIIDVRKRMRNRLTKGDLSNKIGQYMSAVDKNEQLSPDDARIEGVISAVLENALNSKDFKVFDGEWKTFTLNLIKTMDRHQFLDISSRADILREVCQNMNPTSLQRLSSCFSNSETDKTLLSHTLHQVLHFTIRFALNTLRHVFRINRQSRFCIRFDGSMEEVVTDFSNYSRNTLPKAKALRQPSVSSFTQIDDFDGLPDEWIIEYKAALDTNTKLLAELDRAKARLDAISK
ncbi:hypothetical protein CAEBREN_14441 [Caenorhabditis brenneri]|uniref:Uncharacterized protein n=1 Tax=Caenorhabditis brenneri TaxID=135651 RepID=G0NK93_CAEBE|nr:hypothetical protein CAEBREN_14441 [Caenorhabditis brenneri]